MTLGPIVLLCLVLLAVAVLMPGKKKAASELAPQFQNPFVHQQVQPVSIRQQQSDEAAAAVAAAFKQADDAAWLQEQIDRAAAYFSPTKKIL